MFSLSQRYASGFFSTATTDAPRAAAGMTNGPAPQKGTITFSPACTKARHPSAFACETGIKKDCADVEAVRKTVLVVRGYRRVTGYDLVACRAAVTPDFFHFKKNRPDAMPVGFDRLCDDGSISVKIPRQGNNGDVPDHVEMRGDAPTVLLRYDLKKMLF